MFFCVGHFPGQWKSTWFLPSDLKGPFGMSIHPPDYSRRSTCRVSGKFRDLNHPSGFGDQKKASLPNQQKILHSFFGKKRQPGFWGGKRLHHGIGSTCKGVLRAIPSDPRSLRCARGLAADRLPGATGGDAARLRAAAAHQHRGEAPRTWLLLALAGRSGSALAVGSRPVSGCRRILFAWGFHLSGGGWVFRLPSKRWVVVGLKPELFQTGPLGGVRIQKEMAVGQTWVPVLEPW